MRRQVTHIQQEYKSACKK